MWQKISWKKGYIKTKWLKTAYFWAEPKKAKKTLNENYKCLIKKRRPYISTLYWKSDKILKSDRNDHFVRSQFKLLYTRLATNEIGVRPNDLYTFCRNERESLIHLFWYCRKTNSFWKNFQDWLIKNLI